MISRKFSEAEAEQSYIKNNAINLLLVCVYLCSDLIYGALEQVINSNILSWSYVLAMLAFIGFYGFNWFMLLRDGSAMSKKAYWRGSFEDEYSKSLAQTARTSAFVIGVTVLILTFLLARLDAIQILLARFSVAGYAKAVLACMLFSYSATVLSLLWKNNE